MPRAHVVADGSKLAALRGEADLTQLELARQAGYGLRTIGKIESGRPTGVQTLSAAATVLSRKLGRPIGLTDLLKGTNGSTVDSKGTGLVEELVRYLDLGELLPGRRDPAMRRALLVDRFRFRQFPAARATLCFPYSSTAERTDGACLSHPEQAHWQEVAAPRMGRQRKYRMQVDLTSAANGPKCTVTNAIEYIGAFDSETRSSLDVPIVWSTENVTVLVLFPAARPCRSVRGLCPPGEQAQPVLLPGSKLVHWRITAAPAGVTYRLEWDW